jgi:hypothetical protein
MLAMLLFGLLLATAKTVGALPTMVLVIFALSIGAHVAANALGTRLRDHGGQGADPGPMILPTPPSTPIATTNLSHHESLGWPLWFSIALGLIFGGVGGAILFTSTDAERATFSNTLLGSLAFAVIGGMVGFLGGSFIQVVYRAWHQAKTGDLGLGTDPTADHRSGSSNRNVAPSDSPSL